MEDTTVTPAPISTTPSPSYLHDVTEQTDWSSDNVILVTGEDPLVLPGETVPEAFAAAAERGTVGFECASGEWIEREWTGIPVLEVLDRVAVPDDTTHVQLESIEGNRACVPLTDLPDAIIAVGEADGLPRFVSPHVVGPRTIKNLRRVQALALEPGEDREDYEDLPFEE